MTQRLRNLDNLGPISIVAFSALLICIGAMLQGGCGTEVGNPKKPGTSKVADDEEAATYVISANLNETTASISEDVGGSQAALSIGTSLVMTTLGTFTRTCVEASGAVVITESGDSSTSDEVTRRIGTVKRKASGAESVKKTWSGAGDGVHCNAKGDGVKLSPSLFSKGKLNVDFTRQKTTEVDLVRRGVSTALQRKSLQVKGTREIDVARSSDANVVRLDKTLKTTVSRDLSYVKATGESSQLQSQVFTDADRPMKVQVYFESGAWTRRLINSGRLVSVQTGDSSVTLDFDNVEYTRAGGCSPVSGKISGSITRDGESDAALTFQITIASDGSMIKYSDGREEDYVAEKCPLDP